MWHAISIGECYWLVALVEKGSNLKPIYRSMSPNIYLSTSYSVSNLFDGEILLKDERLLVN